jgi:hypothetical protein
MFNGYNEGLTKKKPSIEKGTASQNRKRELRRVTRLMEGNRYN